MHELQPDRAQDRMEKEVLEEEEMMKVAIKLLTIKLLINLFEGDH